MVLWVRIFSWALVAFCAPSLIYSLATLDWPGAFLNAALLTVGILDLRNVKLHETDPNRARRRMSWTQLALGVLVGASFALLGSQAVDSDYWEHAREIIGQVAPVSDHEWKQAVAQSKAVLKWGTLIGAVAIFLGQVGVFLRLRRPEKS